MRKLKTNYIQLKDLENHFSIFCIVLFLAFKGNPENIIFILAKCPSVRSIWSAIRPVYFRKQFPATIPTFSELEPDFELRQRLECHARFHGLKHV